MGKLFNDKDLAMLNKEKEMIKIGVPYTKTEMTLS